MRSGILAVVIGCVALPVAVIACTSGGANNDVNGGGGGSSASASDFVASYCKTVGQCCGTQGLPSDGATCTALFTALESGSTYDPAEGSKCLSAVNSAAGADPMWCVKSSQGAQDTACKNVYKKPGAASGVAPGGQCKNDSDCAEGPAGSKAVCASTFSASSTTSTCQIQTPGKEGDGPCLATIVQNADGSTSTYTTSTSGSDAGTPSMGFTCAQSSGLYCNGMKCTKLGVAGDTCSGSESCGSGTFCGFVSGGEKCVAKVALGGDCSMSSQSCVDGAYCDQTSKKCTAQLAGGAACTTSDSCKSHNCNNKTCDTSSNIGTAFLCGSK